jgi:hypothetical protein
MVRRTGLQGEEAKTLSNVQNRRTGEGFSELPARLNFCTKQSPD